MLTYKEIQTLSQLVKSVEEAASKLEQALSSKNSQAFEGTKQLLLTFQKQIKEKLSDIKTK